MFNVIDCILPTTTDSSDLSKSFLYQDKVKNMDPQLTDFGDNRIENTLYQTTGNCQYKIKQIPIL